MLLDQINKKEKVIKMSELIVTEEKNILDDNSLTFDERKNELQKVEKLETEAKKREKNSPFSRWTQFNLEHTKELMWLAVNHPKANAILYFLVDQMDDYNAVMCSTKVITEVLGISRQTVSKNISILKEAGFIAVLRSGSSNIYSINDKVYWKSWGNKRQYSKFPANVILGMSEQEESLQEEYKKLGYNKIKEIKIK